MLPSSKCSGSAFVFVGGDARGRENARGGGRVAGAGAGLRGGSRAAGRRRAARPRPALPSPRGAHTANTTGHVYSCRMDKCSVGTYQLYSVLALLF